MTDELRGREDMSRAFLRLGIREPNYSKVLTLALMEIDRVKRISRERKENVESIMYHHVINKGVNNLYKDIIKKFFERFGDKENHFTGGINYESLRRRNTIDQDGLPQGFSHQYDIPPWIKEKINDMKVKKPVGVPYTHKNALEFGCAKIALLACVHCVMLDIHENVAKKNEMPARFFAKLKNLRKIITDFLIEKNEHGVYVDSEAKQWWDDEYPRSSSSFDACKRSVTHFLENIATNRQFVILWGHWVYSIVKMIRFSIRY